MSIPQSNILIVYLKAYLLVTSSITACFSLVLLVCHFCDVEAKRISRSFDIENQFKKLIHNQDISSIQQAIHAPTKSLFAQMDSTPEDVQVITQEQSTPINQKNPLYRQITVTKGDTLSTLFEKIGLPAYTINKVLASNKQAKQFMQLKHGQKLEFELTSEGQLKNLHSTISDLESITLTKSAQGFAFNHIITEPVMRSAYIHGVINGSLSQSAACVGLSHSMTMNIASMFGYDIDFTQDIRQSDEFDIIYEQKIANGKIVGTGAILSARFTNRGKTYTAVHYTNKQGNSSYYTADGYNIHKTFIRTPVDFARISSRFSMGRKHPILNKIRVHKGVDYAAPSGTPIKAAGDGKVLLASRCGSYGNTVIIQHGDNYRTLYGHMQAFAKGLSIGSNVKQSQIIGYIGTTGLSTGPHLHYEFQINGVHVDPLSHKLLITSQISKTERMRFLQQSRPLIERMNQERSTLLASAKR
ncbi:peptidoglycan DD-metalloendopeptidase family protein [Candidatus Pseudomonas adelgestsugas]|uniref:Murein DD-endopeptidase MepM n=1 Tax=Candidatus Pseudomonas adelgestsugas TaxID=1302376 RepID=A0ABX5R873_9PSED|nr:peptidoglycan DD-metalloendopeptidase family protein [Candidatus Pseudomonas adelgestsugas]QAX81501.1 Murein DD-endopeptidase MepM [Candidatus Pseudomonas adelgestsugas]